MEDPAIELSRLCRNTQGEVVLRGTVWHQINGRTALSVYAYTGIKSKRRLLLARKHTRLYEFGPETMHTILHNMAHLWALARGVSDIDYRTDEPEYATLYHPTELEQQP